MKSATRTVWILTLALVLTACARQTVEEPALPDVPARPTTPAVPVDTARINPRDFTDPRNLDNPDSLLSQRVIYFEFDRSNVRPEYLPIVQAHADYLRSNPSARVILEGHTDERGSREYNLGLGERRGNSVADLFSADRVARNQFEVVSYGEERPVCRQSSEDCWQRNRRTEIVYTAR